MMSAQAKVSVDTAKEVQSDASLKTKADKDRRLREKNQVKAFFLLWKIWCSARASNVVFFYKANTKKFLDARKSNTIRQNKLREKQKKLHQTQLESISKYINEVTSNDNNYG